MSTNKMNAVQMQKNVMSLLGKFGDELKDLKQGHMKISIVYRGAICKHTYIDTYDVMTCVYDGTPDILSKLVADGHIDEIGFGMFSNVTDESRCIASKYDRAMNRIVEIFA